jgi:exopolysaccharide biosynthesis predicted pyruvyltransferase EpsI
VEGPGTGPSSQAASDEVVAAEGPGDHAAVVAALRAELDRALTPILAEPGRYAVAGYPRGRNVGEYLLWLGTAEQLRCRGIRPAYVCDRTDYAPAALRASLGGSGTILLAGGGNLGDIWPPEQRFRERVIGDFPDMRIVQLPQSMHFRSEENLERATKVFAAHPDLILLLRDPISEGQAREAFGHDRAALCPDMAFGVPPLEAPQRTGHGVLWLGRTDRESRHPPVDRLPPNVRQWDWAVGHGRPFAWGLPRRLGAAVVRARPGGPGAVTAAGHALVRYAGQRLAHDHVARGVDGLMAAEVVVTDRVHGHILALLLGRPQVVLDNGDGKVHSLVRGWTGASPRVHLATSAGEALAQATALLEAGA